MIGQIRKWFRPTTQDHEESLPAAGAGRKQLKCDAEPTAKELEFLRQHVTVHRRDWKVLLQRTERALTARNGFGFGALNEFVNCGTLTVLDPFLGLIALISPQSSEESLRFLAGLVAEEFGETVPAEEIKMATYAIEGGQCTVVELPGAIAPGEPKFVGIATDTPMARLRGATKEDRPITMIYFVLAGGEHGKGKLEEWKFSKAGVHFEEGRFVVDCDVTLEATAGAFVDEVEKILVDGGWLARKGMRDMERNKPLEAMTAFEKVLGMDEAHFTWKVDAFIGSGAIRAMQGTDVISLPGVPFEYEIMRRYRCPQCQGPTDNRRLSGSTEYLSQAIVDHWRATCMKCEQDREIRFAVPK